MCLQQRGCIGETPVAAGGIPLIHSRPDRRPGILVRCCFVVVPRCPGLLCSACSVLFRCTVVFRSVLLCIASCPQNHLIVLTFCITAGLIFCHLAFYYTLSRCLPPSCYSFPCVSSTLCFLSCRPVMLLCVISCKHPILLFSFLLYYI